MAPCCALRRARRRRGAGEQQEREGGGHELTFATYVWQPTTVAATKAIVESWNKTHPGIQVPIVPVDVNSVHDKLLTNFVGGTAADIIHDEAADIAGFTQQGYLGEPDAADPQAAEGLDPEADVGHGQLRRQDHRRPDPAADVQRLREHGHPQGGGHQGADGEEPVDVGQFRAVAKRLTKAGQYGVCWGLRSPTAAIQTMSLNFGGQYFYLENGKWNFRWGRPSRPSSRQMHDMIHVDKSVDAAATGLSGSAVLPAFFGGKCAMTVQGNFQAQGMILQSPKGFNWAMFPLLKGQLAEPGREPADDLDLAAERAQEGGDAVHRVLLEHGEPGEARRG